MKAHDLARALLAGPDVEVAVVHPKIPDFATPVENPKVETRFAYPDIVVEAVVLTLGEGEHGDLGNSPERWT